MEQATTASGTEQQRRTLMPEQNHCRPSRTARGAAKKGPLRPENIKLLKGEEAFCRALPDLLREYEGKWVAYWGEERLDVGDSSAALYEKYRDRINPKELFIELVHPDAARKEFSFAGQTR